MPTNQLYHNTWIQPIGDLHPKQRLTQVRNFESLLYGIYASKSVILSKVAGKIPGLASQHFQTAGAFLGQSSHSGTRVIQTDRQRMTCQASRLPGRNSPGS
jgi:hypothetical protein